MNNMIKPGTLTNISLDKPGSIMAGFEKAHVKQHTRQSKTGKVSQVRDYENSKTKQEKSKAYKKLRSAQAKYNSNPSKENKKELKDAMEGMKGHYDKQRNEKMFTSKDVNLSISERELYLFIENDGNLHRQQGQPIIENLKKKIKNGVYESEKAQKLYRHLADSGSKKYQKENNESTSGFMFTPEERRNVAKKLTHDFEQEHKVNKHE